MGNTIPQSTTVSNTTVNQNNPTASCIAKAFPHFIIEQTFPPGSGRVFRSYRIRCGAGTPLTSASESNTSSNDNSAAASTTTVVSGSPVLVCKAMILRHPESKSEDVYKQLAKKASELEKMKNMLQDLPNILSYQKWSLSSKTTLDHRSNIISQPIFLFRQHLYSTLSDRLTIRPFLTNIEKNWISYQILRALASIHERHIHHGNLTAENICITSWGWVCIVDIGGDAEMKPVKMKDYDPSDFTYYYKKGEEDAGGANTIHSGGGGGAAGAHCYLAPERFYKRGEDENQENNKALTPEMDVFSAGCVIIEMYLNGEKALDLGDLMEYRSKNKLVPSLKQKLNKIESSNMRAACKHMLSLDPATRLSANEYIEKLSSVKKPVIPSCFGSFLWPFMKQFQNNHNEHHCWTHDAKVALLCKEYGKRSLRCVMEKEDIAGENYFRKIIGPTIFNIDDDSFHQPTYTEADKEPIIKFDTLLAETDALIKRLESMTLELFVPTTPTEKKDSIVPATPPEKSETNNSTSSPQSIILILQFLLSSLRHVQRPSSKLLALQLLLYLNRHVDDETRLQRILPNTISLLEDSQALIRAQSLRVLTGVLECIERFPPSDAQLFPQYVMKRIQHLSTVTEDEIVRVAFAECLGKLAVTSKRFLDMSHAMRLQDALDGGSGPTKSKDAKEIKCEGNKSASINNASAIPDFPDHVAQLLGSPTTESSDEVSKQKIVSTQPNERTANADANIALDTTLIPNTYDEEFQHLQEFFTSYITQLTTSSSSHIKRALLFSSLSQLASFFGEEGTTTRLLPTILTFWNDLDDWEVRAALCQSLPSICHVIGRVGTEEFVLPCIEVACFDEEEGVVGWAIWCLGALVEEGLIRGKTVLLGDLESGAGRIGLLQKYVSLLIHPSAFIRHGIISLFCASNKAIGFPDDEVFVLPILRPFLKYEPTREQLQSKEDLMHCLIPPISRENLKRLTQKLKIERNNKDSEIEEMKNENIPDSFFHSINIDESNVIASAKHSKWGSIPAPSSGFRTEMNNTEEKNQYEFGDEELYLGLMKNYLEMSQKRIKSSSLLSTDGKQANTNIEPENNIPLSDAYSFAVPNQKFVELVSKTLPNWYEYVRSTARIDQNLASELSSLNTLRSLAQVYGLSVTLPSNPNQPIRKWRSDFSLHENMITEGEGKMLSKDYVNRILSSAELKIFDAARKGELGSVATLHPCYHDASILGIKTQSLGMPPLPPQLGVLRETNGKAFSWHRPLLSTNESNAETILRSEWKPKFDSLVVSSSENVEHTAAVNRLAVSQDQSFFASASQDGTCRVWELSQMEDAVDLKSSLIYSGHFTPEDSKVRVNDICIIENSHSVASVASNGSVHIWRVDMTCSKGGSALSGSHAQSSQTLKTGKKTELKYYETSRVSGSSLVRNVNPREGEALTVSHFNTDSASIVSFGTQIGIRTWDIRCANQPFSLPLRPELGYLTSMTVGNDRNWMVAGTHRGYLALWDIRYQSMVKLWQHSSGAPISRLATCFTTLPQDKGSNAEDKPFIFMGCGLNEAAIFDVTTGECRQCFRVLDPALCYIDQMSLPRSCVTMPALREVKLPPHPNQRIQSAMSVPSGSFQHRRPPPEPSVQSIMGRIGKRGYSYIITGGSDRYIRYWDFMSISRCYTVSGLNHGQPKPSYESVDVGSSGQLYLCRQAPIPSPTDLESSKLPRQLHRGTVRPDNGHRDAILDLKNVDFPVKGLLSCSRDGVIKMWR